ncbi:MAG: hypothetical protein ACI9XO_000721 [Paraglaciecola sp.]|jgi:hypothetical protein
MPSIEGLLKDFLNFLKKNIGCQKCRLFKVTYLSYVLNHGDFQNHHDFMILFQNCHKCTNSIILSIISICGIYCNER